ncbi:Arc family DNA-binding protein [Massilia sp. TN1-12]|uniref:Arc family DNA-binding protein n=1 Tax=Massilia paldalensis TaxID=3377675 RepID=UPI00384FC39C
MNDDNYTRITFRMPKELHSKLQASADATSKSMNSEIIARLEASFSGGDQSALVAAIGHLNLKIASLEFEKGMAEFKTTMLAKHLASAAKFIKSDPAATGEVIALAERLEAQAKPHVERADTIKAELQGRINEVVAASSEIEHSSQPDLVIKDEDGNTTFFEFKSARSQGSARPSKSLPQAADVHPDLVVGDNVDLPGKAKRAPKRKIAQKPTLKKSPE